MLKIRSLVGYALSLLAVHLLSGCASITGTTNQSVSVQTREVTGKEVAGAACELTNSKGTWFVTTPGSVSIHRSNDDMQATCRKEGFDPGRAAIVSETKGSMFGNIIFGGGVGALIDHNNGSAYEYPTLIQIVMGNFTKIEPPKSSGDVTAQTNNSTPGYGLPMVSQPSSSSVSPPASPPPASASSTTSVSVPHAQATPPTATVAPIILAPQQAQAVVQPAPAQAPVQLSPQQAQSATTSPQPPVQLAPQTARTPPLPAQPASPAPAKTKEERLVELKRLYDQGLVSKEAFTEHQKRILDSSL